MSNRLRQIRADYEVLLARKSDWQDGGNKYRSPEYPTSEAVVDVKNQGPELIEALKR